MTRHWPLSTKVVVAYSALIAVVAGALTSGVYWQFRHAQRLGMHDRLLELLNLAAPQIDSDYHTLIVTPADTNKPFYTISQKQFQAIQAASPLIKRIYTFRQQTDGQFTIVLDSPQSDAQPTTIGEPLTMLTPLLRADHVDIQQTVVESVFLPDAQNQPALYGYTPIKDKFGRVDGILAMELDASGIVQHEIQIGILALMIFLVVLSLTIVLVWGLSRSLIVNPILCLNQAAKQLASGQWDQRVSNNRMDELGELSQSFNHMASQLQTSLQQLETYSQTLEEKVTERTQQLEVAKSEAEINNLKLQETLDTLKWTQAQLVHNEKMSGLGQLVAGLAHEINNPISFIYGNLSHANTYMQDLVRIVDLCQQEFSHLPASLQTELQDLELEFLKTDLRKLFASMKVGANRVRSIILSLRNFSRLDESEFKTVDVHEGLESTLMILQNSLNIGSLPQVETVKIQVIKDYGQLPKVECYPGQLNQVFMNVLTNAIDALRGIGSPQKLLGPIQETSTDQAPATITIRTEPLATDWIRIAIADNGPGMLDAVKPQIFDPFFTTKEVGKGTGLGLSISYKIITEYHGGKLYSHSTPGRGSEFVIEIPTRLGTMPHPPTVRHHPITATLAGGVRE